MRLVPRRDARLGSGLSWLLLLALIALYFAVAEHRIALDPLDRRMPGFSQMLSAMADAAFTADGEGRYRLWHDTAASLGSLVPALVISALIGLVIGIACGAQPLFAASLSPALTAFSTIPALALLPVLLIWHPASNPQLPLLVLGLTPLIAREIQQQTRALGREQIDRAFTLGANGWTLVTRVILPQMLPRLLVALRIHLGVAWLLLIAGEALSESPGLGQRLFALRAEAAMALILPYLLWIALLVYAGDGLLRIAPSRLFPWFTHGARAAA
ncbi:MULTISPECIES: ABC transporter permease [Hydrocarboniphaga]|jgi:NitT/TauT family transport system permease protein|uniref:ABC transmembrane type-1 domain-containing protein n=1 Tax=Hydrocarboniphaga effusa AP103 TaxID=1172194 RepID=I7ZFE6_9GAMM|nr:MULTISPECIES: ABC transporter permease subunit [Hydrocarboniphaga]EIT70619.1 hypothetical protein WQQ_07560 [Hydrocarboniphaga effusa AP103]MDZ4081248.1 ABC transporter permease subunit [Hydrocarboniphaga sp.]